MKHLELFPNDTVLVLVDWQEKLLAAMDPETGQRNLKNAVTLVEGAKLMGIPIFVTEQYPRGLGPTVEPLRMVLDGVQPVEKIQFDCCAVDEFEKKLAALKRRRVILSGMETHICVYQTARGLAQLDYDVHVPVDAVVSRRKHNFRVGLSLIGAAGGVLTSTEAVLFDLVKRGEGEAFKTVSRMVR